MSDLTLERVKLMTDYEIGYQSDRGRADAMKGALEGAIDLTGAGHGGAYSAKRLNAWVSSRETDTGELIAAIYERADRLEGADLEHFARGLLHTAAAIVGQSEGPESLSRTLYALSLTASHAWREGEALSNG